MVIIFALRLHVRARTHTHTLSQGPSAREKAENGCSTLRAHEQMLSVIAATAATAAAAAAVVTSVRAVSQPV